MTKYKVYGGIIFPEFSEKSGLKFSIFLDNVWLEEEQWVALDDLVNGQDDVEINLEVNLESALDYMLEHGVEDSGLMSLKAKPEIDAFERKLQEMLERIKSIKYAESSKN